MRWHKRKDPDIFSRRDTVDTQISVLKWDFLWSDCNPKNLSGVNENQGPAAAEVLFESSFFVIVSSGTLMHSLLKIKKELLSTVRE
jgi:hypothetical protein